MDVTDFERAFFHFEALLAESKLLAEVGLEVFAEFPTRLPEPTQVRLARVIDAFVKMDFGDFANEMPPMAGFTFFEALKARARSRAEHPNEPLIELPPLDFSRLLLEQQLVMSLAALDAFMADCARAIATQRPEVLRSKESVKVEDVLKCGSWDAFVSTLVEAFIFKHGFGRLRARIETFRVHVELKGLHEFHIHQIQLADDIRNIVVHSGGCVSAEFIKQRGAEDKAPVQYQLGSRLPLDTNQLGAMRMMVSFLAGLLFSEISAKYFKKLQPSVHVAVLEHGIISKEPAAI